jgi:hypothetical protein
MISFQLKAGSIFDYIFILLSHVLVRVIWDARSLQFMFQLLLSSLGLIIKQNVIRFFVIWLATVIVLLSILVLDIQIYKFKRVGLNLVSKEIQLKNGILTVTF